MDAQLSKATALDHKAIGAQVRYLRKRYKVTLVTLARHMGISVTLLSFLERGMRSWRESTCASVESYFFFLILADPDSRVQYSK